MPMLGRKKRMTRRNRNGTLPCYASRPWYRPSPLCGRQSRRSSKTLAQQKKNKKLGRPKLPKGEAKGRIVPVRLKPEDPKAIEAAATPNNETVPEWEHGTIHDTIQQGKRQNTK